MASPRARGSKRVVWLEFRHQLTDTCLGNFSVVLPVDLRGGRGSGALFVTREELQFPKTGQECFP